jgi:hypothetical protein
MNYAMKNHPKWEDRGLEVVARLVEETQAKLFSKKSSR